MNIQFDQRSEPARQMKAGAAGKTMMPIIDCDIHPSLKSLKDLHPYLSERWREHLDTYGLRFTGAFTNSSIYPKATPALSRRDAWPPDGNPPGSSVSFMREQLLDKYNVQFGVLQALYPIGMQERNLDFAAAICSAINDWQRYEWSEPEPRLKSSINVSGEDAEAAVAEIERLGADRAYSQIAMACRGIEPLGRKRYWPIYEAAVRYGLPLALHVSGENGHPFSGGAGWASYYQETHHSNSFWHRSLATSLVFEGVFERLPDLKIVLIEGGFGWIPPWKWRMDRQWERMRDEVPHLKLRPSEYVERNLYVTSQPMDEPERRDDLRDVIGWIGWDRLLFATDYPHWDFDDPLLAFKCRLSEEERRMIFGENARKVFRFN